MQEVQSILAKLTAELDAREEAIRKKEHALCVVRDLAKKDKVSIDVGGQVFSFSRETLAKHENSVFGVLLIEEGIPFVDRDPGIFAKHIAFYLRHGVRPPCSEFERRIVEKEFEFWCLDAQETLAFVETPNGILTNGGRTLKAKPSSDDWRWCYTHSTVPLSDGAQIILLSTTPGKIVIGLCTLPIVFTDHSYQSDKLHKSKDFYIDKNWTTTYNREVGLHCGTHVVVPDILGTTDPIYLYIGLSPGCEITISQ